MKTSVAQVVFETLKFGFLVHLPETTDTLDIDFTDTIIHNLLIYI